MNDKPKASDVYTVRVIDDIHGTAETLVFPILPVLAVDRIGVVTLDEGWVGCEPVATAYLWLKWFACDDGAEEPIACSICRTECQIVVHWQANGDPAAAQRAMRSVIDGTWKRELLQEMGGSKLVRQWKEGLLA